MTSVSSYVIFKFTPPLSYPLTYTLSLCLCLSISLSKHFVVLYYSSLSPLSIIPPCLLAPFLSPPSPHLTSPSLSRISFSSFLWMTCLRDDYTPLTPLLPSTLSAFIHYLQYPHTLTLHVSLYNLPSHCSKIVGFVSSSLDTLVLNVFVCLLRLLLLIISFLRVYYSSSLSIL